MSKNIISKISKAAGFAAFLSAAVMMPLKVQATGLVGGGASRELNRTSTLYESVGTSVRTTVTEQITNPADVIEEEYLSLAIALFKTDPKYCNVRSGPGTEYSVVGRMYDGSVGTLIEGEDETVKGDADPDGDNSKWIWIQSGDTKGYVLQNFLVTGVAAYNRLDEHTDYCAEVLVGQLNVRESASLSSKALTYVKRGEKYKIVIEDGVDPRVYLASKGENSSSDDLTWIKILYSGNKVGYVCSDYVNITEEYTTAKTIEEIRAEEEAERERKERASQSSSNNTSQSSKENLTVSKPANLSTDYASVSDLRKAMVDYALQFVGNPYVLGGQSLSGTDCSGFTCYVYRDFGISIARTPSGQYSSAGRSISLEEAQPGDIICYGGGGCSHVAMYIGNGQIVHESNPRRGLETNSVYFMKNIIGVKSVLD